MTDNEQKLTTYLAALPNSEEQQPLFSQMINAQSEVSSFAELDRFIEGFRLRARIMLDTFVRLCDFWVAAGVKNSGGYL